MTVYFPLPYRLCFVVFRSLVLSKGSLGCLISHNYSEACQTEDRHTHKPFKAARIQFPECFNELPLKGDSEQNPSLLREILTEFPSFANNLEVLVKLMTGQRSFNNMNNIQSIALC